MKGCICPSMSKGDDLNSRHLIVLKLLKNLVVCISLYSKALNSTVTWTIVSMHCDLIVIFNVNVRLH